jgi:hypothetical protein
MQPEERRLAKMTHLEVQNAVLRAGDDVEAEVNRLIDEEAASAHTLRRALRELDEKTADKYKRKGWIGERFAAILSERGFMAQALSKPDVGEVRTYKIQEESGRQIIKVPVDYLGQTTGAELKVSFDVNGFRGSVPEER